MRILKSIDEHLEEYFLFASLVVLVVVVFLQVIMRYVFQNSLSWSEEFARYIFLWQIWVGASFAAKKSRHLKVEILLTITSEKGRLILNVIAYAISIGFAVFLAYKSFSLAMLVNNTGQITPALGIRMSIPYMSVPVGMTLMVFRLSQGLYFIINEYKTKTVV